MSETDRQLTLLAVFAHPDDETFPVGGTLARYSAEGVRVVDVCATRGEEGQTGDPPLVDQAELGAWREAELRCAARALGISNVDFLGYVDGHLPEADRKELLGKIVRAVRQYRPQVMLSFGSDGASAHPDHKCISALATDAFLASPDAARYPEHRAEGLEPWAPSKLYYTAVPRAMAEARGFPLMGLHDWMITTRIDVSRYTDRKAEAFACHRTQAKDVARFIRINGGGIPTAETFRLAISRLGRIDVQENDLFAGCL